MSMEKKIVLIEDDREIANTIQSVLNASGYKVFYAQNGVDGQKLIESESPELVITDMMMPRMGGFPILEFLKSRESSPKVIMITANEGGRHKAYAEMLGVHDYLRKPFAMELMLESVESAIGKPGNSKAEEGTNRLRRTAKKSTDE